MDFEEELEELENDELTVDMITRLKIRSMGITITYDNYYRTQGSWFHAKSLTGQNISNEKVLEDFPLNTQMFQ